MSTDEYDFDYVNFTNSHDLIIRSKKSIIDENQIDSDNYSNYDDTTTELYRTLRLYKFDPITNEEIPSNLLFEFKYKWDPITGQRTEIDEMGPLCFNAWNLYQYYYSNRYNGLWYPPIHPFQGYYGDLLGCGQNMITNLRPCPEKYLYRLPIIDCYLKKSHNQSIITMGPILTNEEINKIDNLTSNLRKNKVSLQILKEYYDEALNNSPNIDELKKTNSSLSNKELIEKYNRSFVDKLVIL
jgi:hypothetical protein